MNSKLKVNSDSNSTLNHHDTSIDNGQYIKNVISNAALKNIDLKSFNSNNDSSFQLNSEKRAIERMNKQKIQNKYDLLNNINVKNGRDNSNHLN